MREHQEAPSTQMKVIFVVEDDKGIAEVLRLVLAQETNYSTILTPNADEALRVASQVKTNLFIIDYRLATMNGIELYDKLHGIEGLQDVPAILMSASIERLEQELDERGLIGIGKPFELDELVETIKRVAA